MLPDFPRLKERLSSLLTARMKSVYRGHGKPFADLPFAHIQEGDCVRMVRADGSHETIEMKHHQVTIRLPTDEIENLSTEDIYRKFDQAAEEMARKMFQTFLQSVDKAATEVGNVIRFDGHPTVEDLLRFYATVDIDFDAEGHPVLPTLVCGKQMYEHVQEILPQIESDPDVKRRMEAILAKKQEEWRDREASRRLVG